MKVFISVVDQKLMVLPLPVHFLRFVRRILPAIMIALVCVSCGTTYRMFSQEIEIQMSEGNYEKAYSLAKQNRFLKKKRNALLRELELGKLSFLKGDHVESVRHFFKADTLLDERKLDLGREILAGITNPERTTYRADEYEGIALHYYNALNFIFLRKFESALVEARRINLKSLKLNEKFKENKALRYDEDPFAHMMMGLVYEMQGEFNNAFIAYRNAINIYIRHDGAYMNVEIPLPLEHALEDMGRRMGFFSQLEEVERSLGRDLRKRKNRASNGELVLFVESGLVPAKSQEYISFQSRKIPGSNQLLVYNTNLNLEFPVAYNNSEAANAFGILNVAVASLENRPPRYTRARVSLNKGYGRRVHEVQNFGEVARVTMKNERTKELAKTVLRLATKKLAEFALSSENETAGIGLSILNAVSEKADTRNWQSLPNSISMVRIPLEQGENILEIEFTNPSGEKLVQEFTAIANGTFQFKFVQIN